MSDTKELRARWARATRDHRGTPLRLEQHCRVVYTSKSGHTELFADCIGGEDGPTATGNARTILVATAVNVLPALLDELDAERERARELEEKLAEVIGDGVARSVAVECATPDYAYGDDEAEEYDDDDAREDALAAYIAGKERVR